MTTPEDELAALAYVVGEFKMAIEDGRARPNHADVMLASEKLAKARALEAHVAVCPQCAYRQTAPALGLRCDRARRIEEVA